MSRVIFHCVFLTVLFRTDARFIIEFSRYNENGVFYYVEQIKALHLEYSTTIYVDIKHLLDYDETLADTIEKQYFR